MQKTTKKLPSLSKNKQEAFNIESLLRQRPEFKQIANPTDSPKDYRHSPAFLTSKASNFISRINGYDDAGLIFNVSESIREVIKMRQSDKQNKQTIGSSTNKQTISNWKKDSSTHKSMLFEECFKRSQSNSTYKPTKLISQERHNILSLAKWIDNQLQQFSKAPTLTIYDILEYKQTVLNYGLGKIIETLSIHCKEQGKMLKLIWDSTFKIFQGVIKVMVDGIVAKETQKLREIKEMDGIYQTSYNFQRDKNAKLQKQNDDIFQKMKKVILWNKRLRKQRHKQDINLRILDYRNLTYSQALEQTVQMLLQTSQEPSSLALAKKILLKLARQKRKKKKGERYRQIDTQLQLQAKTLVYSWIKRNSFDGQVMDGWADGLLLSQEERIAISQLDDQTKMNTIDIYDFFKLLDYGVQVSPQCSNSCTQSAVITFKNAETITHTYYKHDQGMQTGEIDHQYQQQQVKDIQSKRESKKSANLTKPTAKDKAKEKEKAEINKTITGKKKDLNKKIGINAPKQLKDKNESQKQSKKYKQNPKEAMPKTISTNLIAHPSQQQQSFAKEYSLILSNECKNQTQNENSPNQLRQDDDHEITNHRKTNAKIAIMGGRRSSSLEDFLQDKKDDFPDNFNQHNEKFQRKRRQSMTFINPDTSVGVRRLQNNKRFAQTYKQQKQFLLSNTEEFYSHLIRRRSFYTKKKVEYENATKMQQSSERQHNLFRTQKFMRLHHKGLGITGGFVSGVVDKLSKKYGTAGNCSKIKNLSTAKQVFIGIQSSIEQITRIPPKNKQFINSSLITLNKYISSLVADFVRQLKRQRQDLPSDGEKALYPLNILLMETMTFKYGLKDIAQKKIKDFVEKILTFMPVSEKIGLYGLLLGLEGGSGEVGADELLIYLKCIVYFDNKKMPKEINLEKSFIQPQIVKQNIGKILESFFSPNHIALINAKLEEYLLKANTQTSIEGVSQVLIRELIAIRKDKRDKYAKVHDMCSSNESFFTNVYKLLKMINNYRKDDKKEDKKEKKVEDSQKNIEQRQQLRATHRRNKTQKRLLLTQQSSEENGQWDAFKISRALKQLMKRSDVIDQLYGKSLSEERFINCAIMLGLPMISEIDAVLLTIKKNVNVIKFQNPKIKYLQSFLPEDPKFLQKLHKKNGGSNSQKFEDPQLNQWNFGKMWADRVEEQIAILLGKTGIISLGIQTFFFNM